MLLVATHCHTIITAPLAFCIIQVQARDMPRSKTNYKHCLACILYTQYMHRACIEHSLVPRLPSPGLQGKSLGTRLGTHRYMHMYTQVYPNPNPNSNPEVYLNDIERDYKFYRHKSK